MVTANLDNVKLEAAVLDPEISAMGFVLTCSATVEGDGVKLELGAGEKMYEVSVCESDDVVGLSFRRRFVSTGSSTQQLRLTCSRMYPAE